MAAERGLTFQASRDDGDPAEFARYLGASLIGAMTNLAVVALVARMTPPCGTFRHMEQEQRLAHRQFSSVRPFRISQPVDDGPSDDNAGKNIDRPLRKETNIDSIYYRDGVDKSIAMRLLKKARIEIHQLFLREMKPDAETTVLDIGVSTTRTRALTSREALCMAR